jgi:hypothetical protein
MVLENLQILTYLVHPGVSCVYLLCILNHFLFCILQEYLQFEIDENEFDRTRELYERLLDRTKHLKVWISYTEFEASAGLAGEDGESEEIKKEVSYHEQQIERVRRCRGN